MGLGKEVADAYISVHGDLTDFRNDLEGASAAGRAAAIEAADSFGDMWAQRMEKNVAGEWHNIVDAMYKNDKISWERLLGDTDKIDQTYTRITELMQDMVAEGKMLDENYESTLDTLDEMVGKMKDRAKIEKDFVEASRQNAAFDQDRLRVMREATEAAEAYAKTLSGMRNIKAISDMDDDFKKLAATMNAADMEGFVKGFDNLNKARARIYEVTSAMEQQNRITREQSEAIQANINAFIDGENAKSKAMRDALAETQRLKRVQDEYNISLRGMTQKFHFGKLEADFQRLAAAIDSSDFSAFARGARNIDEFKKSANEAAFHMHRLGRMTDQEYTMARDRIREAAREQQRFNVLISGGGRDGGDFFRTLRNGADGFGRAMGRVNNLTRGFREHLQGFAGLNVFGDMIRKGLDFIHNLDRISVKLGTTTLKIGSMAAIGGSSLAGLVVIASDLGAALGGLGAAAPAFFIGAGIGIAVLQSALKDMKTVLADLAPAFHKLQDSISAKFWAKAQAPIRSMVKTLLPTLTKNLNNTATSLGGLTGKFADAVKAIPTRFIDQMFNSMNKGIDNASGGMKPLVRAFTTLGLAGSMYFERFGTWIAKLSTDFDAFITGAAEDGRLLGWIDNMIEGFKNIGRSIDGLFGIFNAIDTAARAAGAGGLKEFADKLQGIAAVMQSPRFQATTTMLFSGMGIAVGKIGEAIKGLGPALESVMPSINLAFADIGAAVGKIIDYVGQILNNPTVQKGITDFTGSMDAALGKLAPGIKPFGDSLGSALTLLGKIAESVATVATAFLVNLGPVLDSMSTKLGALVQPLADSAKKFIEDMKGPLESIDKNIIGPLVEAINTKLLPVLTGPGGFSEEFAKFVTKVTEALSPSFKTLFSETLPAAVTVVTELLEPLGNLFALFTPTLDQLLGEIADGFTELAKAIKVFKGEVPIGELKLFSAFSTDSMKADIERQQKDYDNIFKGVGEWFDGATENNKNLSKDVTGWFERSFANDQQMLADIGKNIENWWKGIEGMIKDTGANIGKLWDDTIGAFWDTVFGGGGGEVVAGGAPGGGGAGGKGTGVPGDLSALMGLPDSTETKSWFETFGTDLSTGFTSAMGKLGEALGLSDFGTKWNEFWAAFPTKVTEVWTTITTWITTKYTEIKMNIEAWIADLQGKWTTFWDGFWAKVSEIWTTITTWIQTKATEIKTAIETWVADLKLKWDTFWTEVGAKVQATWDFVMLWIQAKATEIKTGIETWVADIKAKWETFWTEVGNKVQATWDFVMQWIAQKVQEIRTNIDNFIATVKANWESFWTTVSNKVQQTWDFVMQWINQKVAEIRANIDRFIADVKTNWDNFWTTVSNKVTEIWETIKRGVQTGIDNIIGFFQGMPQRIKDAVGDLWGMFSDIGTRVWEGLKSGIEGGINWVTGAARNLAEQAVSAAQNALDINSPSKVFRRLGLSTGEGFVQGVDRSGNSVMSATENMANIAIAAFSQSRMYLAGVNGALGLADGLASKKGAIVNALGSIIPDATLAAKITTGTGGVGAPTPVPGKSFHFGEGAIKVTSNAKDPETVAHKFIDEFAASYSNL